MKWTQEQRRATAAAIWAEMILTKGFRFSPEQAWAEADELLSNPMAVQLGGEGDPEGAPLNLVPCEQSQRAGDMAEEFERLLDVEMSRIQEATGGSSPLGMKESRAFLARTLSSAFVTGWAKATMAAMAKDRGTRVRIHFGGENPENTRDMAEGDEFQVNGRTGFRVLKVGV